MRDPGQLANAGGAAAGEAYRLLAQCCCAAGGLAGLWLGFLAGLGKPGGPDAGAALLGVMVPVGSRVAAGVVAGALVAWAVAALIPRLRPVVGRPNPSGSGP